MARFIECQQGSELWHACRIGLITASCFADAISTVGGLDAKQQRYVDAVRDGASEKEAALVAGYKAAPTSDTIKRALRGESTVEASDIAKRYAADLAIEIVGGQQWGIPAKAWVLERGHIMEAEARRIYEARTGAFVTEAGICVDDAGYGYSTDGLIESDGLMEVKAPIDSIKVMEMWRTGDVSEYMHQMQGGMWITGRKWCDFIMYVPNLAPVGKDLYVRRIHRDDEFIDNMVARLAAFHQLVLGNVAILRAQAPLLITNGEDMITTSALDKPPEQPEELAELEKHLTPEAPPTLSLGKISMRLGFTVTADFLLALGFAPAATVKAAKLFHERDFPSICAAIIRHVEAVAAQEKEKENA